MKNLTAKTETLKQEISETTRTIMALLGERKARFHDEDDTHYEFINDELNRQRRRHEALISARSFLSCFPERSYQLVRITDKFNAYKAWEVKRYPCGHFHITQEVKGQKTCNGFIRTTLHHASQAVNVNLSSIFLN